MGTATLLERLAAWCARTPGAEAAREGADRWSVQALLDCATRVATGLVAAGVQPGDRVAWWGPPSLEFAAVLLGSWRVDATYLGINPRYTPREVGEIVERARPRLVLCPALAPQDDMLPATYGLAPDQLRTFGELVAGTDAAASLPAPTATFPALLVFTTGSTGRPKGALISHRAVAAASASQARATHHGSRFTVNALPSNHIGGLVNVTTASWWDEQSIIFVPSFTPAAIIDLLHDVSHVRLPAVPLLLRRCLDAPGFAEAARERLVHVLSGGAPLPRAVLDEFDALGVYVQGMYGQTEMSGSACFTHPADDPSTTAATIGRPHADVELRLGPVSGAPGHGDEGELQVRGAQVFDGYLHDPDATRAAFTSDGWLRSGDLAVRRPDGTIQLSGRLKEIINTRGYKVMPGEVEEVLATHAQVSAAAVVGTAEPEHGEAIVAFVTLRADQAPTAGDLVAWCRERLAHYKVPRRIVVLDAMPMLGVGKVDKRLLTARAAGGSND